MINQLIYSKWVIVLGGEAPLTEHADVYQKGASQPTPRWLLRVPENTKGGFRRPMVPSLPSTPPLPSLLPSFTFSFVSESQKAEATQLCEQRVFHIKNCSLRIRLITR